MYAIKGLQQKIPSVFVVAAGIENDNHHLHGSNYNEGEVFVFELGDVEDAIVGDVKKYHHGIAIDETTKALTTTTTMNGANGTTTTMNVAEHLKRLYHDCNNQWRNNKKSDVASNTPSMVIIGFRV